MSYRNYQNKQNNDENNDLLNDLYSRLAERETGSDLDISQSIKSMSKRWLQEAYIDGMMLADKLSRVTASAKQNLDQFTQKNPDTAPQNSAELTNPNGQITQMVEQEVKSQLQKLGLLESKEQSNSKSTNLFPGFAFGMILLLSGFFIIAGAFSYYGLDTKVASFANQTYASLSGETNSQNKPAQTQNNSTISNLQTSPKIAIAPKLSESQSLDNLSTTPESAGPSLSLPNTVAANSQNLTSTKPEQAQTNPSQSANSLNQAQSKVLPASCNGQEPILNKPLNIQNPSDRAMLYCILDLQSQNQTQPNQTQPNQIMQSPENAQSLAIPNQSLNTPSQAQTPNPNQIPQR